MLQMILKFSIYLWLNRCFVMKLAIRFVLLYCLFIVFFLSHVFSYSDFVYLKTVSNFFDVDENEGWI